ncbi:TRAP-type C4-dicarboxylate transport system permease small subunit [Pseudorhizobium tarimense]|uniref:TRAP transporter small permease protein n=1 Tax=Pseudorhizobium tarimense TaxID=1079109 RepID=A0ABV2HDZ0_9HYPH|nr:TRAP transporter small permease [Pseudorhizobium tarimense]MCJ8521493.1 TRAP transporter small permease [Pseudorhizobium tarimense]
MPLRSSLVSAFLAVEGRVTQAAVALGTAGLAIASVVGLYQVVSRFVLHAPASWSEPLVQATLIWMTYVALAGAIRTGTLISVDLMLSVSTGRLRRLTKAIITVSILALLAVLFWFGTMLVWRVRSQTMAGLGISASWAYAALPVGSVLSALALVAHVLDPSETGDHRTENAG